MRARRPFRDVKLQWLQLLSCDPGLSDCAKTVALYIITTHMNGHTEKAWPSYQTIADATGKSVKTIQRAVRDLENAGWFEVQRGNGVNHNTVYTPAEASILRACAAREKTDKIVPLRPEKGGQPCPQRGTNSSLKGGQNCPPNLENEKINKPNAPAREAEPPCPSSPVVFVAETRQAQLAQWRAWLTQNHHPGLEALNLRTSHRGQPGFALPSYWPPREADATIVAWIAAKAIRRQPVAECG
ncbi:helix-turn-helix domain-containing protein [Insolitispirillum peregrinum]|uniref:helix-turn-helix domain-containing protein n=1 Tax=Insolitispirillum peregrinum TaxID=80876 RepID=UPI00360B7B22